MKRMLALLAALAIAAPVTAQELFVYPAEGQDRNQQDPKRHM